MLFTMPSHLIDAFVVLLDLSIYAVEEFAGKTLQAVSVCTWDFGIPTRWFIPGVSFLLRD